MAVANTNFLVTKQAAMDLTDYKHYILKLNSSNKVTAITAITDTPYGVAQNGGVTDIEISIAPIGSGQVSKIILGATLATGAKASVGSTGKAVADASTSHCIGIIEDGGADTNTGSILLTNLTVTA